MLSSVFTVFNGKLYKRTDRGVMSPRETIPFVEPHALKHPHEQRCDVPIDWIRKDKRFQPRYQLDTTQIEYYARLIYDERSIPPAIDLAIIDDVPYCAHGNHRLASIEMANQWHESGVERKPFDGEPLELPIREVPANVAYLSVAEAVALGMTANGRNGRYGLALSPKETRRAIEEFLRVRPQLPDDDPRHQWARTRIAESTGGSEGQVRAVETELDIAAKIFEMRLSEGDRVAIDFTPIKNYYPKNTVELTDGLTATVTGLDRKGVAARLDPLFGGHFVRLHPDWCIPTDTPEQELPKLQVGDVVKRNGENGTVVATEEPESVRRWRVSPSRPVVSFEGREVLIEAAELSPTGERDDEAPKPIARINNLNKGLASLPKGAASDRTHEEIQRTQRYLRFGDPDRKEDRAPLPPRSEKPTYASPAQLTTPPPVDVIDWLQQATYRQVRLLFDELDPETRKRMAEVFAALEVKP